MQDKYPFTFGRMVIDLRHQFFGHLEPSVFVIADMWAKEENGDEDVWCDHYRVHSRVSFNDLHNPNNYKVLGFADPTRDVREQCKQAEKEFQATDECQALVRAYNEKYHPERLNDTPNPLEATSNE